MAGRGLQDIPLRVPDQWDAAWFTRFVREVLAQADIRNAIEGVGVSITGNSSQPATIAANADIAGLLNVPFVTLSLSSQLTAERVLTAGDGIALTDGGAGSTITISVDDIPYDLFGDLPALSVFGNQLPTASAPGPIGGTQAGDVLWIRDVDGAGTLNVQFSNEPIWSGDHQWLDSIEAQFGDDMDLVIFHTGTAGAIGNATGPLGITALAGDLDLTASADVDVLAGASINLAIGVDLQLAGDPGDADQVLTSHGAGTPPTWEAVSGGAGSSLVFVNTTVPAGNTVANTTAETAFASTFDIPADLLAVGSVIRVKLFGVFSTTGTPTLRLRIKLDATTYIDTTAVTTVTATNFGFTVEAQLVVTAIGASGSIDSQGLAELGTAATTGQVINTPNTSGIAADTTQDLTVSVTAQWSAADPANTITLRQMAIWIEEAADNDASLAAEILADTPTAFWKLDETAGTTFADSSGNGNTLTIAGTVTLANSLLIPTLPATLFPFFANGANGASVAGDVGTTPPLTGDYTIESVICPIDNSTQFFPFSIAGNGESDATNAQAALLVSTAGILQSFWENGAGATNIVTASSTLAFVSPFGRAFILALVKDGTANTVTFFVNGKRLTSVAYVTEPSGGSSVDTGIGGRAGQNSGGMLCGYVSFYNGAKLSAARLAAHAVAAGLAT